MTITSSIINYSNQPISNDKGSVLVLTAFLLMALFGLIAISIDITLATASVEQARHNAKLAALAALEAYMSTDGEEAVRLNAALVRANQVAQLNLVVADLEQRARLLTTVASGIDTPQLIPGRWFYALDNNTNNCLSGEPPCFVPLSALNPLEAQTVNSFRVQGNLYEGVTARFARVIGVDTVLDVFVEATATTVPRHGCFVVDISASMVRQTHLLNDAEYVYGSGPSLPRLTDLTPNRNGASGNGTDHYQDDYILIPGGTILTDSEFNSPPYNLAHATHHYNPASDPAYSASRILSGPYHVDHYRDATHLGPEPLSTVFAGLQHAVSLFRKRSVSGDKACIILYDSKLIWPRIVRLTDDFDYLEEFANAEPVYLDAGRTELDPSIGLGRMLRHALFPAPQGYTNTTMALGEALKQFNAERQLNPSLPSSDFIVHIGDGLTNCTSCLTQEQLANYDYTGDGVLDHTDVGILGQCIQSGAYYMNGSNLCTGSNLDINGDGVLNQSDSNQLLDQLVNGGCGAVGCQQTFSHHRIATTQLRNYVETVVVPTDIPIHVVLVGDNVGPHTLDIASSTGTNCLSDGEARAQGLPFVLGGDATEDAFNQMSPSAPYYAVNTEMYAIAAATRGLFAPIRPADASCVGSPIAPPQAPLCDPLTARRLTDPRCRDLQGQMKDYMEHIMGQNPYVIVQTN